jgi:hypothetical protein
MFSNKYYIIRHGDFATNGNKKILYSLFSIYLSLDDYYHNHHSFDCFKIMIGSTLIWTLIELFLNKTNTRVIKPMYLHGFRGKIIPIPKYWGIFLQGFQEGGVVTTFGLYFGDRLQSFYYLGYFHLFIIYILMNMIFKKKIPLNTQGQLPVESRRQVNTISSLTIMASITAYNSFMLYLYPEHAWRQFTMFFAMVYVCSIWTMIAYYKNFRNVEVYTKNSMGNYYKKNPSWRDVLFILGYDVLFEIGIAYLTFYNWFLLPYYFPK